MKSSQVTILYIPSGKFRFQNDHYLSGVHVCDMVKREDLGLRVGVQPERRGGEHR